MKESPEIIEEIKVAQRRILLAVTFVFLSYILWFGLIKGAKLSASSGDWGTFGDYVGGLLNPLMAYTAFLWLTKTYRLQKLELAATSEALAAAAESQKEQAELANKSARIAALSTLVNSIEAEIAMQRQQLQFLANQLVDKPGGTGVRGLDGKWYREAERDALIKSVNDQMTKRLGERFSYEEELKVILGVYQKSYGKAESA